MERLGKISEKEILYTHWDDINESLNELPSQNWLVFVIGNDKLETEYVKLAKICIDRKVLHACTCGTECKLIHDTFDQVDINRLKENGEYDHLEDSSIYFVMTTWNENIEDEFWFAATTAFSESGDIEKIVCVDFTDKNVKFDLQELITKIDEGWLPDDDD